MHCQLYRVGNVCYKHHLRQLPVALFTQSIAANSLVQQQQQQPGPRFFFKTSGIHRGYTSTLRLVWMVGEGGVGGVGERKNPSVAANVAPCETVCHPFDSLKDLKHRKIIYMYNCIYIYIYISFSNVE